jgi:hypothetical protein
VTLFGQAVFNAIESVCALETLLLGLQDTPGAAINASDVVALTTLDVPVRRILEVLAAVGFLNDDRVPTIERWFATKTADLPADMVTDLKVWFTVMRHGSTTPPRSHPRDKRTIATKLRWALPALHVWAADGHQHLREIACEDVLAALPPSGTPRHTMLQGLRSIFRLLKAHKVVFVNPTTHIPGVKPPGRVPLATPVEHIRHALVSDDPTRAAIAALVAFHALASHELRDLRLADVHDGRLHLPERSVPLAQPVRARLRAYLDYRAERWPATANPHLFIHYNRQPPRPRANRMARPPARPVHPGTARRPHPARSPCHQRRRPATLRPVRPLGRRRRALHRHARPHRQHAAHLRPARRVQRR